MARVIKKSDTDLGDIDPDTGFGDAPLASKGRIITGEKFEARTDAQSIRNDAQSKAEALLERARTQAQQILEDAQAQGDQIRADAKQEGYNDGRNEGAAELSEIVASASQRLQQVEAQAIPQLRELSLTIARKVLGRELEFHPDAVVDVVKQALSEKARQRREIFLRVHPDDLEAIREGKASLLEMLSRCQEIGIREDEKVARFGVIIETDAGIIDAQLDTQLAVFERVLKETQ